MRLNYPLTPFKMGLLNVLYWADSRDFNAIGAHPAHKRRALRELPSETARTWNQRHETPQLDPCTYCGAPSTGHDHITPSSARGDNEWTNLTGCCPSCNSSKQTHSMLHHLLAQRIRADIDRGIGDLTRGRGK